MSNMSIITCKAFEMNEYFHHFAMKTIERYAVKTMISDIAEEFYEN